MATYSIAFIGTGVMGRSMAAHLLKAGHTLHVFNRTKAKAQPLMDAGAHWHDTVGSAAAESEFVFTIVGFPSDVEETYFGQQGVLAHARKGAVLVDMTTSSPSLAQRISNAATQRGLHALDAPVSGGDIGAKEARLVIMAGGDPAAFARVKPLLEVMGKNIVLQGGPGAGQHCKMANQISIASIMMSWCEALTYAKKAGLDPTRVIESIGSGAAASWSLNHLAPRALKEDFAPGFYVKHFLKDMRIALESAEAMDLTLPGLTLAKKLYDEVAQRGWEENGTQVLLKWYQTRS